jgi:flagellar hook protein FlgE
MALLRSLLTGVSGLRAQQTAIDVTGDNIANVSTTGFKASRANFSTLISQNMRFGSAPAGNLGGTNPTQVGLGVQVSDIQRMWKQGQLRQTGLVTDLALDDGSSARSLFVLTDYAGRQVFTRDGTFGLNRDNVLYDPSSGYKVQGWMADTSTQIQQPNGTMDFALNASGPLESLEVQLGNLTIAQETTTTAWAGNLNGGGEVSSNASVLESEALFDQSSGLLIPATDSTLLINLARSSTGAASGSPVDLNIQLGSVISIEANRAGQVIRRDFVVGDPPPTGGQTLGDLRDWMQGALGIDRSGTPGNEMISAQRINSITGEPVNGTLDQIGATGFLSMTISGSPYQTFAGAAVAGTTTAQFDLSINNSAGTALAVDIAVNVVGTGVLGSITSADIQGAVNAAIAAANLSAQFEVSGSSGNGFRITNSTGNSFTIADGANSGATDLFGAAAVNSAADSNFGTAQQPQMQVGDTITFDNFTPLMAAQTLTAGASGSGNSANRFEIGASAAQTAINIATAINLNPTLSGLVTATVVGNQIQLQARQAGADGNFQVQISNPNGASPSTVGVSATNVSVGATLSVSANGSAVSSRANGQVDSSLFPNVVGSGALTGSAADTSIDLQLAVQNLPNSPLTISIPDQVFADATAFMDAVAAAINADATIVAAGIGGTFAVTTDNVTGNFTLTNSANAGFALGASAADPGDFANIFTSAISSTSNGINLQVVPSGGSAGVGFTAVTVGETAAITTQRIAAAINSSIHTNPPIAASAMGDFLRLTDQSSIASGQGNALQGGQMILSSTGGFGPLELGTSLIGAGASADLFIAPDAASMAGGGIGIATIIDDEVDFVSAGVQVGDFVRFHTGPSSGLIARITHVGQVEDPNGSGQLISNPHALRFEVVTGDQFPVSSVPSAYTIHEAASVDIGVNSFLSATNPPEGLDTASDAGRLRVSGHVGAANRLLSLDLKVRNPDSTTNTVAAFNSLSTADGESFRTSITAYDSLGIARRVDMTFWMEAKSNSGVTWRWQATAQDNNVTPGLDVQTVVGSGSIMFDTLGRRMSDSGTQVRVQLDDFGVDQPLVFNLDFSRLTGFAADVSPDGSTQNPTEIYMTRQDGFKAGTLDDFAIGTDGRITGFFSNGLTRTLGQIAVARFSNPEGLAQDGDNYFRADVNSGDPIIGTAGTNGRGIIRSGFLEDSTVELSEAFTDLITAQRAFQANARTISTSSQLLQELVNLI